MSKATYAADGSNPAMSIWGKPIGRCTGGGVGILPGWVIGSGRFRSSEAGCDVSWGCPARCNVGIGPKGRCGVELLVEPHHP